MTRVWRLLALTVLLALQACATVAQPDARDPMESFNRSMFGFNEAVDKAVIKPVATGYKAVTPDWMRKGVGFTRGLQGRLLEQKALCFGLIALEWP